MTPTGTVRALHVLANRPHRQQQVYLTQERCYDVFWIGGWAGLQYNRYSEQWRDIRVVPDMPEPAPAPVHPQLVAAVRAPRTPPTVPKAKQRPVGGVAGVGRWEQVTSSQPRGLTSDDSDDEQWGNWSAAGPAPGLQ